MSDSPVLVLEFNELTPSLIDRFIKDGDLPNFAKFRSQSQVFRTMADEEPPNLEPWIQWVTVHTGLPYSEHGLFHLNEGHKLTAPRVWDAVLGAGAPVLVCGSMNVRSVNDPRAILIPDPWCTTLGPKPEELNTYFRFVQQNVLEHTNDRLPLSRQDYVNFLTFMMRHGLTLSTIKAIAGQLLRERSADVKWQRVPLLDLLQLDVFMHYWKKAKPKFATFFLNSTAHYQHAYWDSMEPQHFPKPTDAEKVKYRDAIRFGYKQMDRVLGRLMADRSLADTNLVLCTALSQQPSNEYAESGASDFFRPKNFEVLVKAFGLAGATSFLPVMSEQFYVEFESELRAKAAMDLLATVTVGGRKAFALKRDGSRVFAGCGLHDGVAENAVIAVDGRTVPFFDVFYRMDTAKTGVHHPEGVLWIRQPSKVHKVTPERVPLTAVAPTLLQLAGVSVPSGMHAPALSSARALSL